MEHKLFKPSSFEEGKHEVVGDCNGIPMQTRWEVETPLFAKAIVAQHQWLVNEPCKILDYGCGVGRLAKEVLKQYNNIKLTGTDASESMMLEAKKYVSDERFSTCLPTELTDKFDIVYLVYVLQHCPAIEIREVLARIHYHLKDDGIFVYCSSDYRMAIRFDQGGFFDDRFLGIDLQEEIGRLFDYRGELFDTATLDANPVLKTMIVGGLPHPAKVFTKKKLNDYLHIGAVEKMEPKTRPISDVKKVLLMNRLAPGDILVMTNAIRDLKLSHPEYQIDVRSPCPEIFDNNPRITRLSYNDAEYQKVNSLFCSRTQDQCNALTNRIYQGEKEVIAEFAKWIGGDILAIDMHYPLINSSGEHGSHFGEGHREWLEHVLDIKIPLTSIQPELFLSQSEQTWISPVAVKQGYAGDYWVINAGGKFDYTLKQYPYYQEVVNLLKDKVTFVQIGIKGHNHKPLDGVIDMVGQTANMRDLFRLIYRAQGVITCVSLPMHVAAAFRLPCVVVAGAREGTRWELYPNHQFIYVNGCLPCATYDGCWRSKLSDCDNQVNDIPRCMTLIKPEDVARSVLRYYEGEMIK